jgi:hypothetical protein
VLLPTGVMVKGPADRFAGRLFDRVSSRLETVIPTTGEDRTKVSAARTSVIHKRTARVSDFHFSEKRGRNWEGANLRRVLFKLCTPYQTSVTSQNRYP